MNNRPKCAAIKAIIAITAVSIAIITNVGSGIDTGLEDTKSEEIEYINIDNSYHHIGDANNSKLFPEAPNTEGFWYIKHFNLPYKKERMYIDMQTRDVDPSIEGGPARIFINGKFCCYLNPYVDVERLADEAGEFVDNFASLEIEVKPELFNIGDNSILIIVGKGQEEMSFLDETKLHELKFKRLDDIQFWDLRIKLEGKKM